MRMRVRWGKNRTNERTRRFLKEKVSTIYLEGNLNGKVEGSGSEEEEREEELVNAPVRILWKYIINLLNN